MANFLLSVVTPRMVDKIVPDCMQLLRFLMVSDFDSDILYGTRWRGSAEARDEIAAHSNSHSEGKRRPGFGENIL